MDDAVYNKLTDAALRRIEDAFKDVDAEDVDLERAGDVLTLTFRSGKKCVLNTQRPTRQIWVAANARAWHFDWNEGRSAWVDDKRSDVELYSQVASIVKEAGAPEITV